MTNVKHSELVEELKFLQSRVRGLLVNIYFIKQWMLENNRRDNYYEWNQHFDTYSIIYRPIMRELTDKIRAIKQEIKKVNGKNL